MKTGTLFLGMLLCLAPVATRAAEPDAQSCPVSASRFDTDRFYAQRATEILRAGAAKNQTLLAKLVSPKAFYDIQSGDVFLGGARRGAEAIIELVRIAKFARYQIQSPFSGPIALQHLACTWDVTLLFPSGTDEISMQMTFSFVDGLLTKVQGRSVEVFEGDAR